MKKIWYYVLIFFLSESTIKYQFRLNGIMPLARISQICETCADYITCTKIINKRPYLKIN